jgi:hypothetical protein
MQAKELRIGNWVTQVAVGGSIPCRVSWLTLQDLSKPEPMYKYEGTPLSPDILEKAGFVEIYGMPKEYFRSLYSIRKQTERGKRNLYVLYINAGTSFVRLTDVPYLHQLQNLYHSLTGEELTVNL